MVLRESEGSYRALFEAIPQPMSVCHRESLRILAVNDAALRLLGRRREELLGVPLPQVVAGDRPSDPQAPAGQVTHGRLQGKDGGWRELELAWHPCEFEGESAQLVLWSEQEGREAELQQQVAGCGSQLAAAQRDLETFSYSVSHDLQAPLRHIDGFSRALLDDYQDILDDHGREYLTRICQAAAKMSQLIDAIQKLSRVARSDLDRKPVNLSVAARVISLELQHGAPGRKVEFRIEEGVSVEADPRLARQLMDILIGNAWKFTSRSESALIEFGLDRTGGETVFFVRDNGTGFDMAYADKLFTIFNRLHRADEFEGAGVGLAIAQRIVGRHGGRIWAESSPGAGAVFRFTFQGNAC